MSRYVEKAQRFLDETRRRMRVGDPENAWLISSQWLVHAIKTPDEFDGYAKRKSMGLPVIESLADLEKELIAIISQGEAA